MGEFVICIERDKEDRHWVRVSSPEKRDADELEAAVALREDLPLGPYSAFRKCLIQAQSIAGALRTHGWEMRGWISYPSDLDQ